MERREYLENLKYLLQDIPEEEKQEALDFYESYFEEGGPAQEQKIMEELGSPEAVAAKIKGGILGNNREENIRYTETGYQDDYVEAERKPVVPYQGESAGEVPPPPADTPPVSGTGRMQEKQDNRIWKILFLIFTFPIWLPILLVIIGVLFALVIVVLSLGVSFVASAVGIVVGGLITLVISIRQLWFIPLQGVLGIGIGCMMVGGGILLLYAGIWLFAKVIPALVKGMGRMFGSLFNNGRRKAA